MLNTKRRMTISGPVSFDRTLDMISLRFALVRVSITEAFSHIDVTSIKISNRYPYGTLKISE